jgi:hypothetical protein
MIARITRSFRCDVHRSHRSFNEPDLSGREVVNSSPHNPLIKQCFPYAPAVIGKALPGFRRYGG